MGYKNILVKKEEGVVTITLNRPEVGNAINEEVVEELIQAIEGVSKDKEARVLVLTGAGKAFCAGAQVKGQGQEQVFFQVSPDTVHQNLRHTQMVIRKLRALEIPAIAMVNGAAAGAGMGFAMACDLRIVSDKAKFAESFTKVGVIPGSGDTWILPRLVGAGKAAELLFTGDIIDAREAERIGLVNRVVPAEELEAQTMALARKLAAGPPIALKLDKMLLYKGMHQDMDTALELIAACAPMAFMSDDAKEGLAAFQEKRPARFLGR